MTKNGFSGRTAIVTGGARGIGLAVARRLAAGGAAVAVWDLDPGEAPADPAVTGAWTVDVTDPVAIETAFAATLTAFGQVDILVTSAGINGPTVPVADYPLAEWQQVLAVDLTGVFLCCRAVLPHMVARGYGRIVNIASIAGKDPNANASAYNAAKAGVIGFTKGLGRELATTGVVANCITPAITETGFIRDFDPAYTAATAARIPMGRMCTVPEIAELCAWMAGEACSFTTGAVFDISGGRASY